MKHTTPKYTPPHYSPTKRPHVALRIYDFAVACTVALAIFLAVLFMAFSAQGCGPHKAPTSYTSSFQLQFVYQPYTVYIHKSWDAQERQCISAAVYAHLDVWFAYRGGLTITPPKTGKIYVHGKGVKYLVGPKNGYQTAFWDGGHEIHVVAISHKLPGLIESIERHQNPEDIQESWIPTSIASGYNPNLSYKPSPLTLAWQNVIAQLETIASPYVDLYQLGLPCKYDGR